MRRPALPHPCRLHTPMPRAPLLVLTLLLLSCGGGGDGDPDPPRPPVDAGSDPVIAGQRIGGASPVPPGCDGGRRDDTVFAEAEVEPWVAVSPRDRNHLVAAWQQDRSNAGGARALVSARSTDGGRSWQTTLHPLSRCGGAAAGSVADYQRASDPWVDIGADGTVHLMGLALNGNAFASGSSNALLAQRSTDGGASWSPPDELQRDGATLFNDKNTLTADPTDARFVYAVWDRLDAAGNGPTLLARSTDGGSSWEASRSIFAPLAAGGVAQTIGNRIVVLPGGPERGRLVNVFTQLDSVGTRTFARVRVQASADRGQTWADPVTVSEWQAIGTSDPETGAPVRDGAIVPTIAAGPSGQLWVAWQDARFSGGARDAIALSGSSDGGRSWSAPVAVNRDPSVAAFTPVLATDAAGRVGLLHFDLRSNTADRNTLLADLWLLSSSDGLTWTETALARRVDLNRAALARGGRFLGDYHGLVATAGGWLAVAALPGRGDADRSDVYALPAAAGATAAGGAAHAARSEISPPLPGFEQARQGALQRALQARRDR